MVELPDEPAEESTERNGFLSYAGEVHAFILGVYRGLSTADPTTDDPPEYADVEAEPWYYAGGFLLGWAIGRVTDRNS